MESTGALPRRDSIRLRHLEEEGEVDHNRKKGSQQLKYVICIACLNPSRFLEGRHYDEPSSEAQRSLINHPGA